MTKTNEQKLFEACRDGNLEGVRQVLLNNKGDSLLLNGTQVTNDVRGAIGSLESPLFIACWNGHVEVVKLLLQDKRIEVSFKDLCRVYEKGNKQITKLLVERMPSKELSNGFLRNGIFHQGGQYAPDNKFFIDLVSEKKDQEMLELLVEKYLNVNESQWWGPNGEKSWAREHGAVIGNVRKELSLERLFPEISMEAYMEACRNGDLKTVQAFLQMQGNDDFHRWGDAQRGSPIGLAALNGHQKIVELILAKEIEWHTTSKGKTFFSMSPLEQLSLLTKNLGFEHGRDQKTTNAVPVVKDSPLRIVVMEWENEKEKEKVIFPKINFSDALENAKKKVKLVQSGEQQPINLVKATEKAFEKCQEFKKASLQQSAVQSLSSEKKLWNACRDGDVSIVQAYLKTEVNVNWTDSTGKSPLFIACENGHVGIVRLLLANENVDVARRDLSNATPFFVACENGHTQIAKVLLSDPRVRRLGKEHHKIPVELPKRVKPATVAVANGEQAIVELLLAEEMKLCYNERQWEDFSQKSPAEQLEYLDTGVPVSNVCNALGFRHGKYTEIHEGEAKNELWIGTTSSLNEPVLLLSTNFFEALTNAKKQAELAQDEYQRCIALLAQAAKECVRKIMTPDLSGPRSWLKPRTERHEGALARSYAIIAQAEKLAENENFSKKSTTYVYQDRPHTYDEIQVQQNAINNYLPTLDILINAIKESKDEGKTGRFKSEASLNTYLVKLYDDHPGIFGFAAMGKSDEEKIGWIIDVLENMKEVTQVKNTQQNVKSY